MGNWTAFWVTAYLMSPTPHTAEPVKGNTAAYECVKTDQVYRRGGFYYVCGGTYEDKALRAFRTQAQADAFVEKRIGNKVK